MTSLLEKVVRVRQLFTVYHDIDNRKGIWWIANADYLRYALSECIEILYDKDDKDVEYILDHVIFRNSTKPFNAKTFSEVMLDFDLVEKYATLWIFS